MNIYLADLGHNVVTVTSDPVFSDDADITRLPFHLRFLQLQFTFQ